MFVACVISVGVGVAAQGEPSTQRQQPGTSASPATQIPQPAADSQQPATEPQAPTEQRRQPAPATARGAQDKVTISGCIQNAPTSSAGATASASAAPSFVLAKGKMVTGAAGSNATGASGSAVGTTGTGAAGTQYRLEGDAKTISPHVNHQVEITGTVQNSSASATGSANAAPGSTAAGGTVSAGAGPMLKVESVKMLSTTCQ